MLSFLSDLWKFVWASINNWGGYSTGGVIVALIALWSLLRSRPLPRRFGVSVAIFFLFFGIFKAWRDQYHYTIDLQSKLVFCHRNRFI